MEGKRFESISHNKPLSFLSPSLPPLSLSLSLSFIESDQFFVLDAQNELSKLATTLHIESSAKSLTVPFSSLNTRTPSIPPSPSPSEQPISSSWSRNGARLLELLQEAVHKRLVCSSRAGEEKEDGVKASPVAVLFSGGLDSAVIAALVDR